MCIWEANTIKQVEMKKKKEKKKSVPKKNEKPNSFAEILKTHLKIHLGGTQTNGWKDKLVDYNAFHSRDDRDRLYVSRKERGKRLANIEDCLDPSIQQLHVYVKKNKKKEAKNKLGNRNSMKNNCMDVSREKPKGLRAKKQGHSYEREISR